MKYEFHPEALFEFEAAADFYADCQEGLEIRLSLMPSALP